MYVRVDINYVALGNTFHFYFFIHGKFFLQETEN